MRTILLAVVVIVVHQAAFAQKPGKSDRIVRNPYLPYSVLAKREGERVIVIAEIAELRDGTSVLGTATAAAQKAAVVPYPKLHGKRVIVVAQNAELHDQAHVVGTVHRGAELRVEKSDEDRYQVWWSGRSVSVARSDVIPFDRALGYFTEAIRQKPTDADYKIRGRIRRNAGDLDGALHDFNQASLLGFNQAMLLEPTDAEGYDWRGRVWDSKGDLDRALADFDSAVRLDPKFAATYRHRGNVFRRKGDHQKAIADFDTAIQLDPTEWAGYYGRGVIWQADGELDKAILDYTTAIKFDPNCVAAYCNRATVFYQKREFGRAIADYDEAIRLHPTLTKPYFCRGFIWRVMGNFDKAIADFNEAIRINPNGSMSFSNRGYAWREKGNYDLALADFDEAIRLNPKNADAYVQRAWLRATCSDEKYRDGAKAVEDATKACELTDWKKAEFLDTLAAAYAEAGQFDKAVEWQQKAIELAPEDQKEDLGIRLALYKAKKPYREGPGKK